MELYVVVAQFVVTDERDIWRVDQWQSVLFSRFVYGVRNGRVMICTLERVHTIIIVVVVVVGGGGGVMYFIYDLLDERAFSYYYIDLNLTLTQQHTPHIFSTSFFMVVVCIWNE